MLSQNGKDWLYCSVLTIAIIIDCFVVSHVRLFYSSSLIFLVLGYSILIVGRDISQNRKSKNRVFLKCKTGSAKTASCFPGSAFCLSEFLTSFIFP